MKEVEPVSPGTSNRRKLLAGLGILSLLPVFKLGSLFAKRKPILECGPAEEKKTMKLLSQDGKLVEVDISKISVVQKKISDKGLQEWIKKT